MNRRSAACSTLWAALAAVVFCAPLQGLAQGTAPVPFYQPEDATAGLYRTHTGPLARTFAEQSPALVQALQKHCEGPANLPAARTAWTKTMLAWEGLAAVAVGPLVERRSLRSIDFQPLRPELMQRMLARSPRTLDDMVRVGTPAKGLPAIEHLLWVAPVAPGTPACTYAVLAAQEVQREALALNEAFNSLAARPPEGEAAGVAFGEFVNQWLGGLERLRWAGLEKPLREAATRQAPPAFARMPSGQTGAAWRAHWASLRAMALQGAGPAPEPATAAVPIETYLRGRGQLALAEQWRQGVLQADAALQAATPANGVLDATRIETATSALKGVTLLMQAQVAPALEVSIGFSSADGD